MERLIEDGFAAMRHITFFYGRDDTTEAVLGWCAGPLHAPKIPVQDGHCQENAIMSRMPCRLFLLLVLLSAAWSQTAAAATADYARTRYPVVLVHGMGGFDTALGVIHAWSDIPDRLREGGARVYVVQLSPLDSDQVRGEQLLAQLQALQAAYGDARFNLIGHSQGGPTSRYVAQIRPDLVASLTTVAAPHFGSPVADGLAAWGPPGSLRGRFLEALFNLLGQFESLASGAGLTPQRFESAMLGLTTARMQAFNRDFPAGAPTTACGEGPLVAANGVRYESMGGDSVLTQPLDPSDYVMILGSLFFKGEDNDGLVGRCSTHWGRVLRDDYPWNHLDAINQLFGLRGLFSPDPGEVLKVQLNRLKQAGL